MTRAGASGRFESGRGRMDAEAAPPDGVEQDDDGRYWISLTRRQTLASLGAAAGAVVAGLGSGASNEEVGGDRATVGGDYEVRSVKLNQTGTMKSLYVAIRTEHLPDNPAMPALALTLEDGTRMVPGSSPYGETNTIETNLAEVHVVDDPATVSVSNGPALVVSKQAPGIQLVVGGDRHQRSGLGGNAARIHGGQAQSDLPSSLGGNETPALGRSKENGTRVWL